MTFRILGLDRVRYQLEQISEDLLRQAIRQVAQEIVEETRQQMPQQTPIRTGAFQSPFSASERRGHEATWWAEDQLVAPDQHPLDRHPEACWRCDAKPSATDIGLCEPCHAGLVGQES